MNNFYKRLLLLSGFIAFSALASLNAQPNWSYSITGVNATLGLLTPQNYFLNGVPIDVGDYIGVFYYDDNSVLQCGGYAEYTGVTMAITAWGAESGMPKNGFATGEQFNFVIWDASTTLEHEATAVITPGASGTTYITNGLYVVSSIGANTALLYDITSVSCMGLSDGAIDLTATYGLAPYTYLWSTAETTEDISGLSAGGYAVTVTDALSVVETIIIAVPEPSELLVNVLANESGAFMCEALAEAFGAGGTTPYTYLWDDPNAQATALASGLCPGTYEVEVTDANGCLANTSTIISLGSSAATDSAFTLIDTCLVNPIIDTAYVSNLFYTSTGLSIVWTIVSVNNDTSVFDVPYPSVSTPGTFYVGLAINCATKSIYTTETTNLYAIVEITSQMLDVMTELETNKEFLAYPNPVSNTLHVNIPENNSGMLQLRVYNALGSIVIYREVKNNSEETQVVIDVSHLQRGMYILRVNGSKENLFVKKILK